MCIRDSPCRAQRWPPVSAGGCARVCVALTRRDVAIKESWLLTAWRVPASGRVAARLVVDVQRFIAEKVTGSRMRTAKIDQQRPVVAGIAISHAERLVFPQLNVSKLDLARYYAAIEQWIVPHVQGRPLTLLHCPQGTAGPCAYLKHAKAWGPAALRRVPIREKTKTGEYLVADSIAGVVALAQMGVVEIHTWNSTVDDLERPNRIVWDLDPGPE